MRREVRPRASRIFSPKQRLLIFDSWLRSQLPATAFAEIGGVSPGSLVKWRARFEEHGPAELDDKPREAPSGSRLVVVP